VLRLRKPPFVVRKKQNGRIEIRAEGVTGIVRIDDIDFEIAPKFLDSNQHDWQTALWRILAFAKGGLTGGKPTQATKSSNQALVDLLAEAFVKSYTKGSLRGLPQTYRSTQHVCASPRGSLDMSQIKLMASYPWKYPCTIDVLSADTPLSSLIRWAATCLSSMVSSPSLIQSLRYLVGSLSFVRTPVPHAIEARKIKLSPQYRELEDALNIALLLLEGSGLTYSSGERSLTGFLWNSDVVFENFMFFLCKEYARKNQLAVSKRPHFFGNLVYGHGGSLETIPDIVFRNNEGEIVAIADAKYKRYGERPSSSDVYQVLSDAHILGVNKVSLLYPVSQHRHRSTWEIPSLLGAENVYLTSLPINLMSIVSKGGLSEMITCISDWISFEKEAE